MASCGSGIDCFSMELFDARSFYLVESGKNSDLKFIIGVTAINAAGLYIQWLKSNKTK